MKIAIIGAGLTGLSCAHELERYGISPIVYEDDNFIGDKEPHISCILNIVIRPISDPIKYFHDVCHLDIKPLNIVKKLTHYTPSKKVVIKGKNFGYYFIRGKNEDSIIRQVHNKLKNTEIRFNQSPKYTDLANEYDYVVVADGSPAIPKELGCWQDIIRGWIKGATLIGNYDKNELVMWINKKYCKNGYAYLCPYGENRASLCLFVPFINNKRQLEYYWKTFLETENIEFKIEEEFAIEHFSGFVNQHKFGNIYLAGCAGGAVTPLLGFGQLNSITMGVFAARSIVEGLDYEKHVKLVTDKVNEFYRLRKEFDTLTNTGYDSLLSLIGTPGIKHITYYTKLNVVKHISKAIALKNIILNK
jgi:flavin-dependent dehydrogenase